MSGFNYRPKISAEMQKRLAGISQPDRYHSHAIAKIDPNGQAIGSTAAPQSHEDRLKKDSNRSHVRQYRHSRLGFNSQREHLATQPGEQPNPQEPRRQDARQRLSQPSPQVASRPKPSFQEPRSRNYNPYA